MPNTNTAECPYQYAPYGFKIKTEGISLERFEGNPIMLDGHNISNLSAIGKWINIKKENGLLTAETSFDLKDENAKKIAEKVEGGFIKGASMGISEFVILQSM